MPYTNILDKEQLKDLFRTFNTLFQGALESGEPEIWQQVANSVPANLLQVSRGQFDWTDLGREKYKGYRHLSPAILHDGDEALGVFNTEVDNSSGAEGDRDTEIMLDLTDDDKVVVRIGAGLGE